MKQWIEWLGGKVRYELRKAMIDALVERERTRKLPAGVAVCRATEARAIVGSSVLVSPRGALEVTLPVYGHLPAGVVLVAWGPVTIDRVTAGQNMVAERGDQFAVLPELSPGYLVRVHLKAWEW
jgi:hypothetical protein